VCNKEPLTGKEADMSHCTWNRVSWQINSIRNSLGQQQGLPFVDLLTPDMLRQVAGQVAESSEPIYTPLVTLWMFLGQVIDPDHSCRQAVARLLVWLTLQGQPACCAETGAYCKARVRLSEEHLHSLVRATGAELHGKTPGAWLWKGRRVKIADGTTVIMPDTEANQAEYPQPDGQKPGLGFPMIRMVVLFCLATGVVLDAAIGAYSGKGTGELSLLRSIWDQLQEGEVLLADRLYCSWFEMALLKQRGVDVVLHRHQSRRTDFRTGQSLGQRDHLVRWSKPDRPDWMDRETYASLPAALELRELEVEIHRKGFRAVKLIIVTTLLDAQEYLPEDLAEVYWQRWHAELDLRSLKETMQMGELRCKSPAMVRKEIWAHFLAYNLIRGMIAQASAEHGYKPCQISFKGAVQTLNAFQYVLLHAQDVQETYQRLLTAIATHRVGDRPGRVEPRAKKRRKKNYAVLSQPRPLAKKRLMKTT
jgi:Transposase DDE domain